MSLMYVYVSMHGLLYLRKRNYLEPQKSVIFGLQPCHFDHETCRGSLNFVLMTMAHALSQNTEINYSFPMEIRSVSSKPFALLKNQTPQITRFFNLLFDFLTPNLAHSPLGDNLTHSMLITACYLFLT